LDLPGLWVSVIQVLTFVVKVVCMLFFFIWIRWTIPRFRYDQLMNLGWKVGLPLGLLNIVVTASWMLLIG
jgi:NADH-quinone oxidoreductase subunit H